MPPALEFTPSTPFTMYNPCHRDRCLCKAQGYHKLPYQGIPNCFASSLETPLYESFCYQWVVGISYLIYACRRYIYSQHLTNQIARIKPDSINTFLRLDVG